MSSSVSAFLLPSLHLSVFFCIVRFASSVLIWSLSSSSPLSRSSPRSIAGFYSWLSQLVSSFVLVKVCHLFFFSSFFVVLFCCCARRPEFSHLAADLIDTNGAGRISICRQQQEDGSSAPAMPAARKPPRRARRPMSSAPTRAAAGARRRSRFQPPSRRQAQTRPCGKRRDGAASGRASDPLPPRIKGCAAFLSVYAKACRPARAPPRFGPPRDSRKHR